MFGVPPSSKEQNTLQMMPDAEVKQLLVAKRQTVSDVSGANGPLPRTPLIVS
jgi:hypothetical protein